MAMITWFVSNDYLIQSIHSPKSEMSKVFTLEATVRPKIGLSRTTPLCWNGGRFDRPVLMGSDAEHMGGGDTSLQPALLQGARPSDYAGDVSVDEAWRVLLEDKDAVLIDVRTHAEWSYVGIPDTSALGKDLLCIEWQTYPSMDVNEEFAGTVAQAVGSIGASKGSNLFFICRSGVRSRSAAIAMTAAGYQAAHNVAGGFEGDLDEERHRGRANGWKAAGLPWRQS